MITTRGILGRKIGMVQTFTKNGILVPVTVIEATPNTVLQVKTNESDGYEAVQVGYQDMREVLSNKPAKGHVAKAKTSSRRFIREICDVELKDYEVDSGITVDSFSEGDAIDITETTRGHGTQGDIKRWGQSRGPEIHGSKYHRTPGSVGPTINRVPEGKKSSGHVGGEKVTVQNLVIEKAVPEEDVLLVRGNVPDARSSLIFVRSVTKVAK